MQFTLTRLPLSFTRFHLAVKIYRETVTIAQCAPEVAPVLAFYGAKLHLEAKDRVVCDIRRVCG